MPARNRYPTAIKNTLIFVLLLAVLAATAALVGTDRTRTATLLGRFSDRLSGVDYRWAYLRDAADDRILDSCLILGNRFTLKADLTSSPHACRLSMPKLGYEAQLELRPRRTVELTIDPEPLDLQREEAIREAIEQLDSTGVSLPDSVWLALKEQKRREREEAR
ncbi:hypothetical protein [uncultured Alistipes sp.]|uniref:hypothetical protein n=1 Tax=uncultured Alistipes sp. TaxID=538949 RepID=UPI002606F4BB|nr:hypothetical protein [uncultured Alistipes sp.]